MAGLKTRAREEESYFVSMTDMMVGLLFVFIIMLMYFALQFHTNAQKLITADETRASILQNVRDALKSQGVTVEIDTDTGVLRLPDDILFNRGEATPKLERSSSGVSGVEALQKLARALDGIIPCYAFGPNPRPAVCETLNHTSHTIELLYIEGHTDSTDIYRPPIRDNWDLSTERAKNTRQILVKEAPALVTLLSAPAGDKSSAPILSYVGQAYSHKICDEDTKVGPEREDCATKNRRIELRIIMAKPKPQEAVDIEGAMGAKP